MLKMLVFLLPFATSTFAMAGEASCSVSAGIRPGSDEMAIRAGRSALNSALEHRDLDVTGEFWLPDAHTTGGGGSLWVGKDQNMEGFSKIFADPNFISGCRQPDVIEIATGGPKEAAEAGRWEWRSRENGDVLAYHGRYLVMWQKRDGQWRIRSELYVTTGCSGGTACQ